MTTVKVCAGITTPEALILVNDILFSTVLNIQTGVNAKFELVNVLVTVAQDVDVVDICKLDGKIIFMRPLEERGSRVVRVKLYEVMEFTVGVVTADVPERVLGVAVRVVVPWIFLKPFLLNVRVNAPVVYTEGGAI